MKSYYVYILRCSDKTYYTGISSQLFKRLTAHNSGKYFGSYTYYRRPVELVYYCEFTSVEQAIEVEKKLKKWSRAKKEALINNEFEKLPNLCKKRFEK